MARWRAGEAGHAMIAVTSVSSLAGFILWMGLDSAGAVIHDQTESTTQPSNSTTPPSSMVDHRDLQGYYSDYSNGYYQEYPSGEFLA